MRCDEVASMLDTRALDTQSIAERGDVAAHLRGCDDCAAALLAHRALEHDTVPALPERLLELAVSGTLSLDPLPKRSHSRRGRVAALAALAAAGGLVFAALLTVQRGAEDESGAAPMASGTNSIEQGLPRPTTNGSLLEFIAAEAAVKHQQFNESLLRLSDLPDGEMFPLLKVAPTYPLRAASRGLEGFAIVEFAVTANGDTEDATIVESSDPVFGPPSIEAVEQFKYKPRIENGEPISVAGVRNRIVYLLDADGQGAAADTLSADPDTGEAQSDADTLDMNEFYVRLQPAFDCLRLNDLPCIERHLDEFTATHRLSSAQQAEVARIYGFVHHRQGNYELAIEAYRRASEKAGSAAGYSHMTIAQIYYERGQYQQAFDVAVEYLRAAAHPSVGDYVFVDLLRELGASLN